MKQIKFADSTLCNDSGVYGFKEKLEIARQLEKLRVDIIELPEIVNVTADSLLIRTASSFVKNSVLSVGCGIAPDSVDNAITSLSAASHPRVRFEVPLSPVGMEYLAKKKPDKMIEWIKSGVVKAASCVPEVEFCAVDATRADPEYLISAIRTAIEAGATHICVCDSAAEMLSDDFASFVSSLVEQFDVPFGVRCSNQNGLAVASSALAVKAGAETIKTDLSGEAAPLSVAATLVKNCGGRYSFQTNLSLTELTRITKQISWITDNAQKSKSVMTLNTVEDGSIYLDAEDDAAAVNTAVAKLGYDLSEEDRKKVYEEFLRVAGKKKVGSKELDAIVASAALQVPATYRLESYVVNNGNIISASAQISLYQGENLLQGVCIGDGPVDAAFRAIDQIVGHHYELDDFQIQSVTEGKEAMGSALVKLRAGGKLYSGNGISTDIIGASIRAYLSAVNKIIYEEA